FLNTGELVAHISQFSDGSVTSMQPIILYNQLIEINTTDASLSYSRSNNADDLNNIDGSLVGLATDPAGNLYSYAVVGGAANDEIWIGTPSTLYASTSKQSIFEFAITDVNTTAGTPAYDTVLTSNEDFLQDTALDLQNPIQDIFSGLAVDATGVIYATLTDVSTNSNVNRLVTITVPDGAALNGGIFNRVGSATGAIQLTGNQASTNITGIDFLADGRLVAVNYLGVGQGQLIAIDTTDTTLSTQLSGLSSDFDNLRGLSANGNFVYSAQNVPGGDDLLLTSSLEFGYYSVNATTGDANLLGTLVDTDGTNITDSFTAIANNANNTLYAVRHVVLSASTRLAALNGGQGVSIATGTDFSITYTDNLAATHTGIIDLSTNTTLTVQDAVDEINNNATLSAFITASIDSNGYLVLTDIAVTQGTSITVTTLNGTAAADLGLTGLAQVGMTTAHNGTNIAGDSLYIVAADANSDGTAELTPLGVILLNNTIVNVQSMDFTRDGKLIGYDDDDQMFVIDYVTPSNSQLLLTRSAGYYANLRGLTTDANGFFYALNDNALTNDTLQISSNGQSLLTYDSTTIVAGTPITSALPVLLDDAGNVITQQITGLATDGTTLFAVRNVNGQDILFTINQTTGVTTVVGADGIVQVNGVDTAIAGMDFRKGRLVAVDSLTGSLISLGYQDSSSADYNGGAFADPNNAVQLSAAGSVSGTRLGLTSIDNDVFYSFDTTSDSLVASNNSQSLLHFNTATGLIDSQFNLSSGSNSLTDTFTGLSYDPDGNLYGVRRDAINAQDLLYNINATNGVITPVTSATNLTGLIQLTNIDTQISAIEFASDGSLFALDLTGNDLIRVDLNDPTLSEIITNNAAIANYDGLTTDGDGLFYSMVADIVDGMTDGRDLLLQSASQQTLFGFDTPSTSSMADNFASLNNGAALSNTVTGLAYNNAGDLYFAIQTSNGTELLSVDSANIALGGALTLTNANTLNSEVQILGADVSLGELDFNSDDTLIAIDRISQTMIVIDTTTPNSSLLLDNNATAVADLMGLSIDANGRVYSIRSDSDGDNQVELVRSSNVQGLYSYDTATQLWANLGQLLDGNISTGDTITALAMLNGTLYGTLRNQDVDLANDTLLTRLMNGFTPDNTVGIGDLAITRGDGTTLTINLIDTIASTTLISEIGGLTSNTLATNDINFIASDGASYDFDVDGYTTLDALITAINTAITGNEMTVSINTTTNNSLLVVDNANGTTNSLTVQNIGNSTAATDLGIAATDTAGNGSITGTSLTDRTVGDLIDAVNTDTANTSRALLTLAALPTDGDTLIINDGQGHTFTFEFDNNASLSSVSNVAVSFAGGDSTNDVLGALRTAINTTTLNVTPDTAAITGGELTLNHDTADLNNGVASITSSNIANLEATDFGVVRLSIATDAAGLVIVDGVQGTNATVLMVADTGGGTVATELGINTSAALNTDNSITSSDLRNDSDILVTFATDGSGTVTELGAISIDGGTTTTQIASMEASTDNNLIGYTVDGTMISIDYAGDTTNSIAMSAAATITTLTGMATDTDGFVYAFDANNDIFVSANEQSLWQIDSTVTTKTATEVLNTLLTDTIVAVAYNATNNNIVAVTGAADSQMVHVIDLTTPSLDSSFAITDASPVTDAINVIDIQALEFSSTGRLLAVNQGSTGRQYIELDQTTGDATKVNDEGTLLNSLVGLTADEQGRFYSVGDDNASNNLLYTSTGNIYNLATTSDVNGNAVGTALFNSNLNLLGSVVGLAFNSNDSLYAVTQQTIANQSVDTLYTLSLAGEINSLGGINVIDNNTAATDTNEDFTKIIGLDFTTDNELLAFDDADAASRESNLVGTRLIQINTTNPTQSVSLTAPVTTTYAGLTVDSQDRLISYDSTSDNLLITNQTLGQVLFSIVHDVVAGTANYTVLGTISGDNLIVELALNPQTNAIYGVMRDKGIALDPTDNQDHLITLVDGDTGSSTNAITINDLGEILRDGSSTVIVGMDFGNGDVDGDGQLDLYAIDSSNSDGPALILLSDTTLNDVYNPGDGTFVQRMGSDTDVLDGFASDGSGIFYSHNTTTNQLLTSGTLFVVGFNHDAPVVTGSVGGVIGQDQRIVWVNDSTPLEFTFTDVAADNDGVIWAIVDENLPTIGQHTLFSIEQDADTGEVLSFDHASGGAVSYAYWAVIGNPPVRNIVGIDSHPNTGDLYIASDLQTGVKGISTISKTSGVAASVINLTTVLGDIGVENFELVALAFSTFQAGVLVTPNTHPNITVVYQTGGVQFVVEVDYDADSVVNLPVALVDENGQAITIASMDYNAQGTRNPMDAFPIEDLIQSDLIAMEAVDPNNPGGRVLYRIGTGTFGSGETFGQVTTVTDPNNNSADYIPDRIVGYTAIVGPLGGANNLVGDFSYAGRFFSIYDTDGNFDENGDGLFDTDELWVSGDRLYAVNSLTALATPRGNLVIQDGDSIHGIAVYEDINGLAFEGSITTGQKGDLYAIWDDLQNRDGNGNTLGSTHESIDRLITIDQWTGEVTVVGTVTIADNPDPANADSNAAQSPRINTQVRGMDFDANGELIAVHGEPAFNITTDGSDPVELTNINGVAGSVARQTIMVHLTDPTGKSTILSAPGSIRGDLLGYAADTEGRFYSIFDYKVFDPKVPGASFQASELWASDDFNPLVSVNGDFNTLAVDRFGNLLSANIDIKDITFVTANVNGVEVVYAVVYNKDQEQTELYKVNRNPITGGLNFDPDETNSTDNATRQSLEFVGVITGDTGNRFNAIQALTSGYDTENLYVVGFSTDVPIPTIGVGSDLGVTTDIQGLATMGDRTFVLAPYTNVDDNGVTTITVGLYEVVYADDGSVSSFTIRREDTGLSTAVRDLASDATSAVIMPTGEYGGSMYTIDGDDNTIYEISVEYNTADSVVEYNVTAIGTLGISYFNDTNMTGRNPVALTDSVKSIAIDRSGKYLYVAVDTVPAIYNPGAGDPNQGDFLIQVRLDSLVTGTIAAGQLRGEIIDQSGNDVDIVAMDFNLHNELIAIDTYAPGTEGALDWRMIQIDTREKLNESFSKTVGANQISLPGSVDTNLQGYAVNQYGRGISIRVGATPSELYISGNQLLQIPLFSTDVNQDGLAIESVVDVIGNLDAAGTIYSNITGLVSHTTQPLLFASSQQTGSTTTNLLTLSITNGSAGILGAVQVDGANTSLLGLATHYDGTLGAIDTAQGLGSYRTINIGVPTVSQVIGIIRVNNTDTLISGIDFVDIDGDGVLELIAYDDSQFDNNGNAIRRLIEINASTPTQSTVATDSNGFEFGHISRDISGLSALSFDPNTMVNGDEFFELYAFANDTPLYSAMVQAVIDTTVTASPAATLYTNVLGDLGGQHEFVDITVVSEIQLDDSIIEYAYALIANTDMDGNPITGYQLARFTTDNPTAVTTIGSLVDPDGIELENVFALATNPANNGDVVFVGNKVGTDEIEVFTIVASDLAGVNNVVTASSRKGLKRSDGTSLVASAGAFTALAFMAGSSRLFGVYSDESTDLRTDSLHSISLVSGNIIDFGQVTIGTEGHTTHIIAMESRVNANGTASLIAIDISLEAEDPAGTRRLIELQLDSDSTVGSIHAMDFDSNGNLFVITQDYDGDINTDASGIDSDQTAVLDGVTINIPSTTDVALVGIDKDSGKFIAPENANFSTSDVRPILNSQGNEFTGDFRGMAFQSDGILYATYNVGPDAATGDLTDGTQLYRISTTNSGSVGATLIGDIDLGGTTDVQSLAFALNADGDEILVGVDMQAGSDKAQLVEINHDTAVAIAMNNQGDASAVKGLGSYAEGSARPLLFASNGNNVIRGSAVSLSVDDATGDSDVLSLNGAEFSPIDGLLYIVAHETTETGERDFFYTIDTEAGNASAIQNSLSRLNVSLANTPEGETIESIAFDQNGSSDTLFAYRVNSDSEGELVSFSPIRSDFTQDSLSLNRTVTVEYLGDNLNTISGLSFVDEDPNATDSTLYAIENNGADSRLMTLDIATGVINVVGPLSDPDDINDQGHPIRGESLGGLTYNPLLVNPFTGELGVLLATDTVTDELVYIDSRDRPPTSSLFQIYVAQASENSSIIIAPVADFDPAAVGDERIRPMLPFEGSIGSLLVRPTNGTQDITISAADGTGSVYIGVRTESYADDLKVQAAFMPITEGSLLQSLGVRPVGVDDLPDDLQNNVSAGIFVAQNLLVVPDLNGTGGNTASISFRNELIGKNIDK
ncbi:MAG: hypothetical protein JKX85_03965, partial [Phycisphaeraceae bacterium]|nr:hypothetical protein [Phycisphaeraceae bacterium]